MEKHSSYIENLSQKDVNTSGSIQIHNRQVINKFVTVSSFPYLISFPRTGSHWLRMLMELYLKKPALIRIFYYRDATDFTCCHDHDLNLKIKRENVIYLYRYPVDTIFSQLKYYDEPITDKDRIKYWCVLYRNHLSKWLFEEGFTLKKTIICYDKMVQDVAGEFKKICEHFNTDFELNKFLMINRIVNKREIKKKTLHDPKAIKLDSTYQREKKYFIEKYSGYVMDNILIENSQLWEFFKVKQ